MELDFNGEKPIFQQIAEGLEDGILSGGLSRGGANPLYHGVFRAVQNQTPPPP